MRLAALAAGGLIFIFTVNKLGGFPMVMRNLAAVGGWAYAAVLFNSWLWVFFYTNAWRVLIQLTHAVRFGPLHRIKICGEAINFMTPLGFVGGDPVRVILLQRYLTGKSHLSSVVIDRLLQIMSAQLFCFLGLVLALFIDVGIPSWMIFVFMIFYLTLFSFLSWFLFSLFRGKGQSVFDAIFESFNMRQYMPGVVAYVEALRVDLALYSGHPTGPFLRAFLWHFSGRILGAVEITVIIHALDGRWLLGMAIVLTSLTSLAATVFGVIPGALGAMEAFYAKFFELNGLSPEIGLSVQIVRRMRTAFWILLGMLLIDVGQVRDAIKKSRRKPIASEDISTDVP
jgi:uncharacterized protein (TIRG00374 family)